MLACAGQLANAASTGACLALAMACLAALNLRCQRPVKDLGFHPPGAEQPLL